MRSRGVWAGDAEVDVVVMAKPMFSMALTPMRLMSGSPASPNRAPGESRMRRSRNTTKGWLTLWQVLVIKIRRYL